MTEEGKELKKVKRRKPSGLLDKRRRVGRTSLKDLKELTPQMFRFCELIGKGIAPGTAGKEVGFSEYQTKTYLGLKIIEEEIEKQVHLWQMGPVERFVERNNEIIDEACQSIIRLCRKDKLSQSHLIQIMERQQLIVGIRSDHLSEERTKAIEKRSKTYVDRLLTQPKGRKKIMFETSSTVESPPAGVIEEVEERSVEKVSKK